jgi:hypothetical protein
MSAIIGRSALAVASAYGVYDAFRGIKTNNTSQAAGGMHQALTSATTMALPVPVRAPITAVHMVVNQTMRRNLPAVSTDAERRRATSASHT